MDQKGNSHFLVFIALVLVAGVACAGGAVAPTLQAPVSIPPTQPILPTQPPQPSSNNSAELQTFTDQNNLYQIDVPGDWAYEQATGEYHYADIFLSPDEAVKVENIVYNDGQAFSGSQNGKFALKLLNTFYSETGREGDIRVTDDAVMDDGSERLTWSSRSGGYSGVSFFEVRGGDRETFLMLTVYWLDSAESQYEEVINNIVGSYRIP